MLYAAYEAQRVALDGARAVSRATLDTLDRLPLPETTRRLVHAILEYQDDRLQDDATVLLARWRPHTPPFPGHAPAAPPAREPLADVLDPEPASAATAPATTRDGAPEA